MSQRILITSALLYANGPLHFGHVAGAYLPADCFARFMRFKKKDVLFLCGSDEYGAAISIGAEKEGVSPQKHIEGYYQEAVKTFKSLDISFDHYSRTTWPGHNETVYEFFNDLKTNGYLEKKVTLQLYSEKDQRFLADRFVIGTCPSCKYEKARGDECPKCGASYETLDLLNPRSKLTDTPLSKKDTEHYFFRLDKLKDELHKWLGEKKWKSQVVNMAYKYIEDAQARSITRDLDWGIPVPGEKNKVFYVWFDAPIGYISAAKDWAQKYNKGDEWKDYWLDPKTKYVQFIGKDNIPFHAVFFPGMQIGQNTPYKMVDDLPANAFYHYEGRKFSKSEGWYIDLEEIFKSFSSDQIRYTIAANAPETDDTEFTWKDFQSRNNTELLGKLGNFVNRSLVFIEQKLQGKIPNNEKKISDDEHLLENIQELTDALESAFENYHLRKATQLIMELATLGNVYFDKMKPWVLIKEDMKRAETVLYHSLYCIKALAVCSYPIIPKISEKIWKLLGFDDQITDKSFQQRLKMKFVRGEKLPKPEILFHKIEDDFIRNEIEKLKQKTKKKEGNMIDIESFSKIDLRVATILKIESVPKSKKLYKLEVDIGDELRTVVSGIKGHYDEDALMGKKIILVANLKPATIMGVESHGMILAGSHGNILEIPSIQNLPAGSKVS